MPKFLLIFSKDEPVRWLGHLDILRTFERAIRRAELPIAFSAGFNPREKIVFASALGTGITGGAERAVIELTQTIDPTDLLNRLNVTLPDGLYLHHCEELPPTLEKSALSGYDRGEYEVTLSLSAGISVLHIEQGIATLLNSDAVLIEREKEGKSKTVDIRPNLFALSLVEESVTETRATIRMTVGQGENGTAKPGEVVTALAQHLPGEKVTLRRSHRVRPIQRDVENARSLPAASEPISEELQVQESIEEETFALS